MRRTLHPVDSTSAAAPACSAGMDDGIMWQVAQFPEPGLAAVVGNGDVVRLAFADPAQVEAFVQRRAGGDAARAQEIWRAMAESPNDSPELKALVYDQILALAKAGVGFETPAGDSLSMFRSYIEARRTYLADEAVRMYDRYLDLNAYRQWKGLGEVLRAGGPLAFVGAGTGAVITAPSASLSATLGAAPDDYVNAAYAGAIPDAGGKAFLATLTDLAQTPPTAGQGAVPSDPVPGMTVAFKAASSAKGVHDLLADLKVAGQIGAVSGKAGIGVDLGMAPVGQVLDAVAGVLTFVAQQEAEAQYATLADEARKPVELQAILAGGSQSEKDALTAWWALATSARRAGPAAGEGALANTEVCAARPGACETVATIVRAAWTKARPADAQAPAGGCTARDIAERRC